MRPRAPGPFPRRWPLLWMFVLAASTALWATANPLHAQDGSEPDPQLPDPQLIADVWSYAAETENGFDHVSRWFRVLQSFGALEAMTAAEAQDLADTHWAARWAPVVEELTKLEAEDGYAPDAQVVANVRSYARETQNGYDHVLRWMRVLHTFDALDDMTAAEAQGLADTYTAERWDPVAAELAALEAAAAPQPDPTATPEATPAGVEGPSAQQGDNTVPTIDSVTPAATSLTVAWTAPAGVTGITAYDVRYITTAAAETATASWTVVDSAWTSGNLEYAITALEKGTGYDVQVRAVTTIDGEWSATTMATTTTTAPGSATLDAVTAGERTLGVAWSEPADTGGAEISSYDLRYRQAGAGGWNTLSGAWQADDPTPTGSLTRIITGLAAGTQYDVQVRASNSAGDGGWSATVTGTPVTDHGDRASATDLALGTLTSGSISDGLDLDWFRLVVAEQTELLLFTHGSLDTYGTLWRGQRQIAVNDDGGVGENPLNFAIASRLAAGTYHLRVEGYADSTGDYELETAPFPETTGRADALPLEAGSSANQVIGVPGDRDWFSFTLPEERSVMVGGVGQGSIRGRLLNSSGANAPGVASIDLPGHDFVLSGTLAAGTWYVEVRGVSGTGLYEVRLADVTESGDTRDDAAPLALRGYAGGRIDSADDADYFRIDLSGRTKTAYVRISARGAGVGLNGELLDSGGDPVPPPLDILFIRDPRGFTINRGLEPGVHYLKVTRTGGSSSGVYAVYMAEDHPYARFVDRCEAISTSYSDPLFGCQWNLANTGQLDGAAGEDINIAGAWATTMGAGITVAVVDDGVHLAHEDLVDNAAPAGSHDYTGGGVFQRGDTHGTAVAGVVAARDNTLGVRGVAPRATIRGLNYILAPTDANAAHAAAHMMETVAVNTNSWGQGVGFRPSPTIWRMAIERGVSEGYGGKGVFYVWSAGNGALAGDNVNYDGIANFHAVTAVCAVNHLGTRSFYSETGATLWVCAPSNDVGGPITTTTGFRYTDRFGGTSAAAPAVAGGAALGGAAHPGPARRAGEGSLARGGRA
ncbi:MAG: S8 family serine peptidase, partial [Acidobacteria bacterium]|nr:S8 family serine peptidase [Acidobacteriota bacterium]